MEKSGAFTGRRFFAALVLLLLIAFATTVFASWRVMGTLRWGMSECLRWQASILSERFILEDAENQQLNALVEAFALQVESGNVGLLKGFTALQAFYAGPVLQALIYRSILKCPALIESTLNADLHEVEVTVREFYQRAKIGKIAQEDLKAVHTMLMEERIFETATAIGFVIPEEIEKFRKNIGLSSLGACRERMHSANLLVGDLASSESPDPVLELQEVLCRLTKANGS